MSYAALFLQVSVAVRIMWSCSVSIHVTSHEMYDTVCGLLIDIMCLFTENVGALLIMKSNLHLISLILCDW
jgi:hypothetical protein